MSQPKIANDPVDDSLKNFKPTDPSYTVSKQFPPNKEKTWPYPLEKCGWVMVHNALRGEIVQLQDTLSAIKARGGTLKTWEVECIQDVFIAHLYNMEEHHSTEDNILSPQLYKRFKYPGKSGDAHEALFAQLDKASQLVKSLKPGDDVGEAIGALSREFDIYKEAIFPHFREEEMYDVPLTRAYFTNKEFNNIMKVGHENNPPNPEAIGCFIHFNGVKNVRHFLKAEGISYFLWHRKIRHSYNKYVTETLVKVHALREGTEPMYPKAGCFSCMSLPDVIEPMPVPRESHDASFGSKDTVGTLLAEDDA